jgi:lantibiotic modifying enzyme
MDLPAETDPSLGRGLTGQAIFFAYMHRAFPTEGYDAQALYRMEVALDAPPASPARLSLLGGMCGVGWSIDHLQGRLLEPSDEDPCHALDATLLDRLERNRALQDVDWVAGLAGWGRYLLDRSHRPLVTHALELLLTRLVEAASPQRQGIAWFTPPPRLTDWQRETFPKGYFDLGVAHGQPGILALLAEAWGRGYRVRGLEDTLHQGLDWFLARRMPHGQGWTFPSRYLGAGTPPSPARIAWCYGDLGVSLALLSISRWMSSTSLGDAARALALHAAERPTEASDVRDPGLCHGAMGNAHLFLRLHHATGLEPLREAALRYLGVALAYHQPGIGIGGFSAWQPEPDAPSPWKANPGLLEGAAGIGLGLLAASTAFEPAWDRILLASIPPISPT